MPAKKLLSDEVVPQSKESTPPEEIVKKSRITPSRETILASLDELVELIDSEISNLRDSSAKNKGIKLFRNLNKRIKTIRNHSARVMKMKKKTDTPQNNISGFQKPVKISNELAKFAGWPEDSLRSRIDVTKYICDYVKEHNLQNPEDRRQIKPDAKLQKLLGYNPKKETNPLKYYSIQSCLKSRNHFPKE